MPGDVPPPAPDADAAGSDGCRSGHPDADDRSAPRETAADADDTGDRTAPRNASASGDDPDDRSAPPKTPASGDDTADHATPREVPASGDDTGDRTAPPGAGAGRGTDRLRTDGGGGTPREGDATAADGGATGRSGPPRGRGTAAGPARRALPARAVRSLPAVAGRVRESRLATAGLVVLALFAAVAVLAPTLAPYDPGALHVSDRLQGPSAEYPLGTDQYGRDVLSRVLLGARVALTVAVTVPAAAMAVGVPVGLVAGYAGGRADDALMRVMDAIFAFPSILLGLTIVAVFGQGLTTIVAALGIVFVPQFARVTRGTAMSATAERHVTAARAMGASHVRVVAVHVLPFCASAILVQATVTAALAIILEASLSFLGVGVPPSTPSWGTMLREGKGYMETAPWYSVAPGVAIVASVLGFNLLGDGLRDVLDPRTRVEQ